MFVLPMAHKGAVIHGACRSAAAPRDPSEMAAACRAHEAESPVVPKSTTRVPTRTETQGLKNTARIPRQPPGTPLHAPDAHFPSLAFLLRNVPGGDSDIPETGSRTGTQRENSVEKGRSVHGARPRFSR